MYYLTLGNSSNQVHIDMLLELTPSDLCDGEPSLTYLSGALAVEWLIEEANAGRLADLTVPGITYGM